MTVPVAPVVVLARWQTGAEALGRVLELLAELRQRSLEEQGCTGYDVYQGADEPVVVVLFESYVDDAAMEAHRNTPHYREILAERILPLLTGRRVELLRPLQLDSLSESASFNTEG